MLFRDLRRGEGARARGFVLCRHHAADAVVRPEADLRHHTKLAGKATVMFHCSHLIDAYSFYELHVSVSFVLNIPKILNPRGVAQCTGVWRQDRKMCRAPDKSDSPFLSNRAVNPTETPGFLSIFLV